MHTLSSLNEKASRLSSLFFQWILINILCNIKFLALLCFIFRKWLKLLTIFRLYISYTILSFFLQHLRNNCHLVGLFPCMNVSLESCMSLLKDLHFLWHNLSYLKCLLILTLGRLRHRQKFLKVLVNVKNFLFETRQIFLQSCLTNLNEMWYLINKGTIFLGESFRVKA